jgi:hypothetical protein
MRRIPSSFQLGSHTFTVKKISLEEMVKLTGGQEAYGYFHPDTLSIYVLAPTRRLKRSVAMQAFWHEVAHAILWVANHKSYTDEKFVDSIGHQLKQFHDTAEFE